MSGKPRSLEDRESSCGWARSEAVGLIKDRRQRTISIEEKGCHEQNIETPVVLDS
jgi:hypothetical protein